MPLGLTPPHLFGQVGSNAALILETPHGAFSKFSNLTEKGMKC
jgi:hypothetical protein